MLDDDRLRVRMIQVGVWLSVALLTALVAWLGLTWDRPHRAALACLVGGAAVATATVARLDRERIVASPHREIFFLGWSLSLVAFIAASAAMDQGLHSPLVLALFLPIVYAALSYPRWAVGVVSCASLLSVVLVSIAGRRTPSPGDVEYLGGLMITLALTSAMCIWQSSTQQQARVELQRLSRSDPLTGSLNRLGFEERAAAELCGSGNDRPTSLVMLDFDGFKAINDQFGHAAGDELLRWAAQAMRAVLRPGDALGRLGGDEFAALLPGLDTAGAGDVADRLVMALSLRVAASAGCATTDEAGTELDGLRHAADTRLYESKHARRLASGVLARG